MSFDNTARSILAQRKHVTRRSSHTVARLHPGDFVRAVNRRLGLRPGERAKTLAVLRVEDVRPAPPLTLEEVVLEGYSGKSVEFLEAILRSMYKQQPLTRVQFSYVALAAPQLWTLVGDTRPDIRAEWGDNLKHLPRGDPRRGQLRELQRLGREEILLTPAAFAEICSSLELDPLDLWREPGTPARVSTRRRRRQHSNQLNLF